MKLPAFKIGKFVPRVKHLTQSKYFPSTLEQYHKVEQIIARYDINSVALQKGELYAAISQFYQNNVKNTIIQTHFHDLNHCFPKWAVPPPWGRCFDIGGRLSLFLNTYFLYNIVVFTLKKILHVFMGVRGTSSLF